MTFSMNWGKCMVKPFLLMGQKSKQMPINIPLSGKGQLDAMRNGQLKPAYNLQHGVDSEYITWLSIGPQPTDTTTLIPFLKDMEEHLAFKYKNVTADSGYESEENYRFIEKNQQIAFIKPANYEIKYVQI